MLCLHACVHEREKKGVYVREREEESVYVYERVYMHLDFSWLVVCFERKRLSSNNDYILYEKGRDW